MASVTLQDKEVRNPILRTLCIVLIVVGVPLILIVMLPLVVPLHFLLVLCGRRGFVTREADGGINFVADWHGFKRRSATET